MLDIKRIQIIAIPTLLVIIQAAVIGCAGNYGRLERSLEVGRLFESHRILPDHKYYYSGPDAKPDGIIGIHNSYSLKSRLWKPVDLTSAQLKNRIDFMTDHIGHAIKPYGALILNHTGMRAGVWYSPYDRTVIKLVDHNHIIVHPPGITTHLPQMLPFGVPYHDGP